MKATVVKTEQQYREYMGRIENLVMLDPAPNSPEGEELALLSVLVESYERDTFPIAKPDPVDAVLFRMHEQDLRQADLVPYFGSRSRVSEFLARRRPLTIAMVREISAGLGIPADVLIQDSIAARTQADLVAEQNIDWSKFPISEIFTRGWIHLSQPKADAKEKKEAVQRFVEKVLGGPRSGLLTRRTIKGEAFAWPAFYALTAWQARVLEKAQEEPFRAKRKFKLDLLDKSFFDHFVKISSRQDGPAVALEELRIMGVSVVIEPHLSRTKLDGAAMLDAVGEPVIGLTLRYDKLDNFWFTLMHECVHVWKHLSNPGDVFLDRLIDKESKEEAERDANRVARDLLISRNEWKSALVRQAPTRSGIIAFATTLGIHPAIVAGRIQQESGNYSQFSDMVGRGEISKIFSQFKH